MEETFPTDSKLMDSASHAVFWFHCKKILVLFGGFFFGGGGLVRTSSVV